jgi:DNA-binding CsgD family transcriptional regulator
MGHGAREETFVDAAARICAAAAKLGVEAAVVLHGANGLMVDRYADATDELRRWMVTDDAWRTDPTVVELRPRLAELGPEILVPLLGPDGRFASIGYRGAPSASLERQLGVLATELAVWCTSRGISTLPDARPLARRQHEVATLAASGRSNAEIASELAISVNTVKLRLKQAFERLGVENRTELANVLPRLAPLDGIPPGISRRGPVTITRGL